MRLRPANGNADRAGYRLLNMINLSLDLYKMEQVAYDDGLPPRRPSAKKPLAAAPQRRMSLPDSRRT